MKRKVLIFLLAGILLGMLGGQWILSSDTSSAMGLGSSESNLENAKALPQKVPQKAYDVLKYIDTYHKPKPGYVGGTHFGNFEGILPKLTAKKIKISYIEWDVNKKIPNVNRGPERLVTGDDKSAWYTADHYKSFTKIR